MLQDESFNAKNLIERMRKKHLFYKSSLKMARESLSKYLWFGSSLRDKQNLLVLGEEREINH
jgi:hypothetical protein